MNNASDYLALIKALILSNPLIVHWTILREEAQESAGLLRYRLALRDGSLLEVFELFRIEQQQLKVTKYRFHWQDADGVLRKRWDSAPHHPELATFPHHVHDGAEDKVLEHRPMTVETLLTTISATASNDA